MRKPVHGLAILLMAGLIASGCSLSGKDTTASGSVVVKSAASLPVYADGQKLGMTNEEIQGLKPGSKTLVVGDPASPVWQGEILVESGETVSVLTDEPSIGPSDEELYDGGIDFAPPAPDDDLSLDSISRSIEPSGTAAYKASLTSDFAQRDKLPQTNVAKSNWSKYGSWGPPAATYPKIKVPQGYSSVTWKRDRVVEVAKKYIGLPYKHYHIPALGLDCSNFTSWVYNYGLGEKFTSSVTEQAKVAGRKLKSGEKMQRGDLMFFQTGSKIVHVGIYIDSTTMIDESSNNKNGVQIKAIKGWYKTNMAYARRVIE